MSLFVFAKILVALRDRQGAVTVDWVMLTASVVLLILGVAASSLSEMSEIAAGTVARATEGVDALQ